MFFQAELDVENRTFSIVNFLGDELQVLSVVPDLIFLVGLHGPYEYRFEFVLFKPDEMFVLVA